MAPSSCIRPELAPGLRRPLLLGSAFSSPTPLKASSRLPGCLEPADGDAAGQGDGAALRAAPDERCRSSSQRSTINGARSENAHHRQRSSCSFVPERGSMRPDRELKGCGCYGEAGGHEKGCTAGDQRPHSWRHCLRRSERRSERPAGISIPRQAPTTRLQKCSRRHCPWRREAQEAAFRIVKRCQGCRCPLWHRSAPAGDLRVESREADAVGRARECMVHLPLPSGSFRAAAHGRPRLSRFAGRASADRPASSSAPFVAGERESFLKRVVQSDEERQHFDNQMLARAGGVTVALPSIPASIQNAREWCRSPS